MARHGLRQKAVRTAKALTQLVITTSKKEASKAKVDNRLLLRLEGDYLWRKLSHLGVKAAIEEHIRDGNHIDSIYRFKSGFTFLTNSKENTQVLLYA